MMYNTSDVDGTMQNELKIPQEVKDQIQAELEDVAEAGLTELGEMFADGQISHGEFRAGSREMLKMSITALSEIVDAAVPGGPFEAIMDSGMAAAEAWAKSKVDESADDVFDRLDAFIAGIKSKVQPNEERIRRRLATAIGEGKTRTAARLTRRIERRFSSSDTDPE